LNYRNLSSDLDEQWFALQVKCRHEKAIAETLQSKAYEAFAPTWHARKNQGKRAQDTETPLFPGYTFARFDARFRLPILMTPGVHCVVGYGHVPTPIADAEINAIRDVLQTRLPVEPCEYLEEGVRVRIVSGSLAGVTGILLRHSSSCRVVLSVCLIRQSIRVEVDRDLLEVEPEIPASSRLRIAS